MTAVHQLRWGIGTAVAVIAVLLLALVQDPLHRQQVLTARFDNVEAVVPGVSIYFRGVEVGHVRSVALDPATQLFDVRLGIVRDWRPADCAFAQIGGSNPLAAPRIDLTVPDPGPVGCRAAEAAAGCEALPPGRARGRITGCRRPPDLFKTAADAIGETAAVAHAMNLMATRLASTGGAGAFDPAALAHQSTAALAALSSISTKLDAGLAPGRGDIALTLANVRRASGRAGEFDMTSLNGTLRATQALVEQNQANIAGLLAEGRATTQATRVLLEGMSASLGQTSGNLARASDSLSALSERLAADPTYSLRGSRFTDPPAPGSRK